MARIDYDTVAPLYDEPLRDHPADTRLIAFLAERDDASATRTRVLDVGCGTGKQLTANRERFPALRLVGVDRSIGMLRVAQRRCPGVTWVHGDAMRLPVASEGIDYVCSQFAHAHMADKRTLLAEVHRVLASGGRFVLTNIDPWAMQEWLVYRYFPAALERDQQDFVAADTLLEWMRLAGFRNERVERHSKADEVSLREFLAYASSRHRISQLTAISDADYADGLRRIRERLASEPDATERLTMCFATYIGDKPAAKKSSASRY